MLTMKMIYDKLETLDSKELERISGFENGKLATSARRILTLRFLKDKQDHEMFLEHRDTEWDEWESDLKASNDCPNYPPYKGL